MHPVQKTNTMHNENYALITGASEGFGKALALECAARGMNLILVALPGSGLSSLACYIERNFGVKTFCFEYDLSIKESCCSLFEEISRRRLRVNMLINNAGMGGTHYFEERNAEYYHRQIALNVMAPTLLSHLFLDMLEKNSPAHILNVSSLASFFYLPKKQVYGGTKSYIVSFSKSLRRELKSKNINVSTVCPGGMNTTLPLVLQNKNLTGISRWSVLNPEEAAQITIEGMLKKKELIIPGFWNRLFILLDKLLPKWLKEFLTDRQMKKSKTFSGPLTYSIHPLKTAI
jgi:short-subunit dehydrogenase